MKKNTYIVTGGAGFIGSNFTCHWLENNTDDEIVVLDNLSYAGNIANLKAVQNNPRLHFIPGDIADKRLVKKILAEYEPAGIFHFAAETHVDRSIVFPEYFLKTNVIGTYKLLEAVKEYWDSLPEIRKQNFRFIHISTDEVYGSLEFSDPPFTENSPYKPNSPYAASKAAADHFVRAYIKTYSFPAIITHSVNNFGPAQFPEKLIPLTILHALTGKKIPVYGDGKQRRNWLYVREHCKALEAIMKKGRAGEQYNIGTHDEMTNIELVTEICNRMDQLLPDSKYVPHSNLISFVKDRPGHDRRYAVDSTKIKNETGWQPSRDFDAMMLHTIRTFIREYQENPTVGMFPVYESEKKGMT